MFWLRPCLNHLLMGLRLTEKSEPLTGNPMASNWAISGSRFRACHPEKRDGKGYSGQGTADPVRVGFPMGVT